MVKSLWDMVYGLWLMVWEMNVGRLNAPMPHFPNAPTPHFPNALWVGLALSCVWSSLAFAGTDAMPLLRAGQNARSLGMGGAYVAIANDVRWNPAGLSSTRRPEITLSNRLQTLNTRLLELGFRTSVASRIGLGTALYYYTVGDVPVINAQAQSAGVLTEQQLAAYLGGGYRFNPFDLGVTMIYASHQLQMPGAQATGNGLGVNAGLRYRAADNLRFGTALHSPIRLGWNDGHSDTSPFSLRVGMAYHVTVDADSSLNFVADIEQIQSQPLRMHLGAEFLMLDGPHAFAIRGGLRDIMLENRGSQVTAATLVSASTKPSIGFGFRWAPPNSGALRIDYALLLEALGVRHILSLSYDF